MIERHLGEVLDSEIWVLLAGVARRSGRPVRSRDNSSRMLSRALVFESTAQIPRALFSSPRVSSA